MSLTTAVHICLGLVAAGVLAALSLLVSRRYHRSTGLGEDLPDDELVRFFSSLSRSTLVITLCSMVAIVLLAVTAPILETVQITICVVTIAAVEVLLGWLSGKAACCAKIARQRRLEIGGSRWESLMATGRL
ncbi:hypothetical protein [Actinomyces weissii]|uniref:Uncharacterized protein n=1 Tax=Actinomyces weissii TaxID=675090 RepID=A0A7T7S2D1_9ACTO|nr:hypothetical protein [Actinomyces weissii]QQM67304.1 hypothetical protein JG540_09975 [Actinomyces weissii]